MRVFFFRLLLVVSTLFVAFDIAELTVRIIKPQLTFTEAIKYADFYLSSDNLIPFSLRKNYRGTMLEFNGDYRTQVSTNSLGYRGPEFSVAKPEGVKRILVLGDSMTFGIGVPDTDTYPAQLDAILKKRSAFSVEVINAGYADGFSPDSYYLYLKQRGMRLKPDVVVLGLFIWNDITDLTETVWRAVDKAGLPTKIESCCRMVDNGALRNKSIAFKYRYPWLRESHVWLLGINTLHDRFHLFVTPEDMRVKRDYFQGCILDPACMDEFKDEEEKVYSVIGATQQMVTAAGSKFVVLILPVDFQLYPSDAAYKYGVMRWRPPPSNEAALQKRIVERLANMGIQFLDMYPVFETKRDMGYPFFHHNAHFNTLGNWIVAVTLSDYLGTAYGL